jgi:hypothetical protein
MERTCAAAESRGMKLRGVLAGVFCAAAAACAQPAPAATPPTFVDPSRDAAPGAPELTTVVVSNDDAGTIRFRINVANQRELAASSTLELYLDTDRNPGSGDPLALGADYRVVLDGASRSFAFGRWDGTGYDVTAPSESVRVWYWSGASISINRSDLGGTSELSFWVRGSGRAQSADAAPNHGTWSYALEAGSTNPRDIDVFFFRVRPAVPRSGDTWALRVETLRLVGSRASVRPDGWSCAATLGGRALRGRGTRGCTFRLPRSARGKRLVVTVTIAYMGEVVSGIVRYRVR